jgi:plastocyanin
MFGRLEVIAFIGFMGLAQAAKSEEHVIIIMSDAFFPSVTYVETGDSVRFVNASNAAKMVVSSGTGWTIGPLTTGEEAVLPVKADTALEFATDAEPIMAGILSFEATPMK